MNAYKIRSIVMADGTIVLKGIPFSVGKSVEIIVLEDVVSQEADGGSVNLPLVAIEPIESLEFYRPNHI